MVAPLLLCLLFAVSPPPHAERARQQERPPAPAAAEARPFFFALSVSDLEASAAWYVRVLGFEEARRAQFGEPAVRIRLLRRDDALIELIEDPAARAAVELDPPLARRFRLHGVFKIGFVVDSLDETGARLQRLGVPLRGAVVEEPDGSMRSLQVEDPDGNVVQIFELLGER